MPNLNAIGVIAKDMEASVAFYRALGMEPEPYDPGSDHVEFNLPHGIRFMIDSVVLMARVMPDWTPPSGGHGMGIAFECDSPAEVDSVYEEMIGKGYGSKLEPCDAFWGQRYASIVDPDGNPVDLYATFSN